MAQRRWLIGVGAAILLGMLMCAGFSLGVVVGRYGPNAQAAPVEAIPDGDAPPAGAPLQPDLVGLLRRSVDGTLELATRQGIRQVELAADTRIGDEQGQRLAADDLRPGDILAVFGQLLPGGARRFQADRIIRLSAPPAPQP